MPTPHTAAPTEACLHALVHGFYADVRTDPLLGPVFAQAIGPHWDAHLARMVDFWHTIALGTRSYRGNVMARHQGLASLTPAHFSAWMRLWTLHTQRLLEPDMAQQLQIAAHGVARNLFRQQFGVAPPFAAPAPSVNGPMAA